MSDSPSPKVVPSKARLLGAAHGIKTSFVSRNNDVGGYWGIGKLALHAQHAKVSTVVLDLIALTCKPFGDEFVPVMAFYARWLVAQLSGHGELGEVLKQARIVLIFCPDASVQHSTKVASRGPIRFECVVALEDAKERRCVAKGAGYCRLHTPLLESRSTRRWTRDGVIKEGWLG
jgi:hypothetical protein